MTLEDADAVHDLADAAFTDLNARLARPPEREGSREHALVRMRHPVRTDPGGCWVALGEGDDRLLGAAQAIEREGIWGLSLLVVRPDAQSRGVGRVLLDRALEYAGGGRGGIILSSQDARAMRRYALAGFALEPAMEAHGPVRRRPRRPDRVRSGGPEDAGDVDMIGRHVRGAGHGRDVQALLDAGGTLLLAPGEGFAMTRDGDVLLLAARTDAVAADLLQAVLADARDAEVGWITARQPWALRVVLDAGLAVRFGGAVFTRGEVGPFRPYLPSGAYL